MPETRMVRRQAETAVVGDDAGPATGTDTVTVACKVPNGLHMVLYDTVREEVLDLGGNKVPSLRSYPRPGVATRVLRGCAVDIDKMRKGIVSSHRIVQGDLSGTGFGLTSGVPRTDWEEWSQTVGKDFVASGMVFAMPDDRRAEAKARELRNERSGLEPLDPNKAGLRMGMGNAVRQAENPASPE